MPHHTHHQDPVSGVGGFLLVTGFLVATTGLLISFLAAADAGIADERLNGVAAYAIPLALAGLLVAGLGIALDQRRMARTVHQSVESTARALRTQTEREQARERRQRQRTSMAPPKAVGPLPGPPILDASSPTAREAPAPRPAVDHTPPPTSVVAPDVMPHQGSAGTRHMHMPLPPPGEPAYPWSGGPGSPPPGPEPGPQPPQWRGGALDRTQQSWQGTEQDREAISARPEPWRQSRVRIIDGP